MIRIDTRTCVVEDLHKVKVNGEVSQSVIAIALLRLPLLPIVVDYRTTDPKVVWNSVTLSSLRQFKGELPEARRIRETRLIVYEVLPPTSDEDLALYLSSLSEIGGFGPPTKLYVYRYSFGGFTLVSANSEQEAIEKLRKHLGNKNEIKKYSLELVGNPTDVIELESVC